MRQKFYSLRRALTGLGIALALVAGAPKAQAIDNVVPDYCPKLLEKNSLDFDHWHNTAAGLLVLARQRAAEMGHAQVEPSLLLDLMLRSDEALAHLQPLIDAAGFKLEDLRAIASDLVRRIPGGNRVAASNIAGSPDAQLLLLRAEAEAFKGFGDQVLGVEHLFVMLFTDPGALGTVLRGKTQFNHPMIRQSYITVRRARGNQYAAVDPKKTGGVDDVDDLPDSETPFLDKYGAKDFTALARDGKLGPLIGREAEVEEIIQVLLRRGKNAPCLVGEAGVGKTAGVEGLAQRIVAGDVPDELKGCRIVEVSMQSLLAGASDPGAVAKRIQGIVREVSDSNGQIILFIDEVHTIVGAGGAKGTGDVANALKPAMARPGFRFLGATTRDEFRIIEKDNALERRFEPIYFHEPDMDQVIDILRGLKDVFEKFHGIQIDDETLIATAELARKHIPSRFDPDKSISLLDDALARLRLNNQTRGEHIRGLEAQVETLKRKISSLERQAKAKEPSAVRETQKAQAELAEVQKHLAAESYAWEKVKRLGELLYEIEEQQAREETLAAKAARTAAEDAELRDIRAVKIPRRKAQVEEIKTELSAMGKLHSGPSQVLKPEHVAETLARRKKIPVGDLTEGEGAKLRRMEDDLNKVVFDNAPSVARVAKVFKGRRTGVYDSEKPATFLIVGDQNDGKSHLAEETAELLFRDRTAITTIDCTTLSSQTSDKALLGADPGFVGYERGSPLMTVKHRPYQILAFTNVEQASERVQSLIAQIIKDGRITTGDGTVLHFQHTVIWLETRVGTTAIRAGELEGDALVGAVTAELKSLPHPYGVAAELVDVVSEVLPMRRMSDEGLIKVLDRHIVGMQSRLAKAQKVQLELTPEAKLVVAKTGMSSGSGGSAGMEQALKRMVGDELSELFLDERSFKAMDLIEVGYDAAAKKFTFTVKGKADPAWLTARGAKGI